MAESDCADDGDVKCMTVSSGGEKGLMRLSADLPCGQEDILTIISELGYRLLYVI